ncbi:Fe2OG dioxygenase domain-containing protein [Plasmodiophora brassicae]|uniref:Fe2OG dioxygenase domain-containing protein n=1 Tax=Plasmodiophora brassicae TaxID=37360 RepID=A0A0G4J203_PLABS|nr:hypothetical protein PBRA_002168 [Plasmodiophora brassicae]SPQ93167.1 unnamed protein product [Plasmodiophora brassicae]
MHNVILMIDLQNDFLSESGALRARRVKDIDDKVRHWTALVRWARRPSDPDVDARPASVVWVRSDYSKPGDAQDNTSASTTTNCRDPEDIRVGTHSGRRPLCVPNTFGAEFYDRIQPLIDNDDLIVTKTSFSSFRDTDLDESIRAATGCSERTLINIFVCGVTGHNCVTATAMDALALGYPVTILPDCIGVTSNSRSNVYLVNLLKKGVRCISLAELTGIVPEPSREQDASDAFDSYVVSHLLPDDVADRAFDELRDQVAWQTMHHRGGAVPRLIAVQATIDDGLVPIYRHPADDLPCVRPWSPIVEEIKRHVEHRLQQTVNHALIQFYRDGQDYISEHSDKTLDIAHGTRIVNVSIGASRVMQIRAKRTSDQDDRSRPVTNVAMAHNSMFVLGPYTNRVYLHAIKQDKRPVSERLPSELLYDGARISLTFRTIATFLTPDGKIFGQGAVAKQRDHAQAIVEREDAFLEMVKAFRYENQDPDFDWELHYGAGFNVTRQRNEPVPTQ